MMKHFVFLASISAALLTVSGCAPGAPAITVDGEKYIFGNVKEGAQVVFTFMFMNTGKSDLVIEDLHVSCDCVLVKQYDKKIRPGEKGKVYGFIDTTGFGGPVTKAIRLQTNASDDPVVLTLEGTIVPRPKE